MSPFEDIKSSEFWKNSKTSNNYNKNLNFLLNCDYRKFSVADINLIAELVLRLRPENY